MYPQVFELGATWDRSRCFWVAPADPTNMTMRFLFEVALDDFGGFQEPRIPSWRSPWTPRKSLRACNALNYSVENGPRRFTACQILRIISRAPSGTSVPSVHWRILRIRNKFKKSLGRMISISKYWRQFQNNGEVEFGAFVSLIRKIVYRQSFFASHWFKSNHTN